MTMRKINPSIKFIGVFIPAMVLSFSYQVLLNAAIFVLCMLLLFMSRASLKYMAWVLVPVTVTAVGMFTTGYFFSADPGLEFSSGMGQAIVFPASVVAGLQVSTRVLAFAGLGMLFAFTTNMQEFVYSLEQQLRLPSRFAYGILAAFNLGPTMPYEYKKTSHAFLARGQSFFPLSPKVLTPLIIKSVRWSESLAVAMESKGFDQDGQRTCLRVLKVKWFDYAFIVLAVGLSVLGVVLLK